MLLYFNSLSFIKLCQYTLYMISRLRELAAFSGPSCLVAVEHDWLLLLEPINQRRDSTENLVTLSNCWVCWTRPMWTVYYVVFTYFMLRILFYLYVHIIPVYVVRFHDYFVQNFLSYEYETVTWMLQYFNKLFR